MNVGEGSRASKTVKTPGEATAVLAMMAPSYTQMDERVYRIKIHSVLIAFYKVELIFSSIAVGI